MSSDCDISNELHNELVQVLGVESTSKSTVPYINYIKNRRIGGTSATHYLKLFIHIIQFFQREVESMRERSIRSLIDSLIDNPHEYFLHPQHGGKPSYTEVEDAVMYIIGTWTLLRSSFVRLPIARGARRITLAYAITSQDIIGSLQPYENSVAGLLIGSSLLPTETCFNSLSGLDNEEAQITNAVEYLKSIESFPRKPDGIEVFIGDESQSIASTESSLRFLDSLESLESLHIAATHLNAYTLSDFSAVDVIWSHNVSRHLLLSTRNGQRVLELFALPCAFEALSLTSQAVGISSTYAQEIMESYSVLFNAWPRLPQHVRLGKFLGLRRICWCWHCSGFRVRRRAIMQYRDFSNEQSKGPESSEGSSEFDPMILSLMTKKPSDWTPDRFPSLWTRIVALEEHLHSAKPWSIWVLFRDRRDTLQFWTFLFGTIVVLLTFVQMVLGIAQVVGSFK